MAIHIIGTIYQETGNTLTDAEGFEYPEMQAVDGFHVNVIDEVIDGADAHIVSAPATPYNLFAGRDVSEHTFYRFDSEAQFREFVPAQEAE